MTSTIIELMAATVVATGGFWLLLVVMEAVDDARKNRYNRGNDNE